MAATLTHPAWTYTLHGAPCCASAAGLFQSGGRVAPRSMLTVVGGELPQPVVDEGLLPPLTDVLSFEELQADLITDDYFIRWVAGLVDAASCHRGTVCVWHGRVSSLAP